ncbi:Maf family protein [Pseudodesulfovibrio sediminis]|uniref:Maf family protein n=1 Tax=Pseudodesulfovibrio sediminis TaxID=2810563 RepID=UPI001E43F77E|nr:Maf family protein [Pseudodesulfovibrio sediminis]
MTRKGPFTTDSPLVLASGSPRRKELLTDLGLDFKVHPSTLDEPAPDEAELPLDYVQRMAEMKALDIARGYKTSTVLGADTIVVLGDWIMGKPKDASDALGMLSALSGRTHQVITGFCIVLPDGSVITKAVQTAVDMRTSTTAELKSYIATKEPMDKAGAYAIQGIGTFLVSGIRGSYTNVVGLPLTRVLEILMQWEVVIPSKSSCALP